MVNHLSWFSDYNSRTISKMLIFIKSPVLFSVKKVWLRELIPWDWPNQIFWNLICKSWKQSAICVIFLMIYSDFWNFIKNRQTNCDRFEHSNQGPRSAKISLLCALSWFSIFKSLELLHLDGRILTGIHKIKTYQGLRHKVEARYSKRGGKGASLRAPSLSVP